MYEITSDILRLIKQTIIKIKIKIDVYNYDNELIETVEGGLVSGNCSIDSESDIRRVCSLVVSPDAQTRIEINENGIIWLNKKIQVYIGIQDYRTGEYTYWSQGIYAFTNTTANYDATTNQINIECSDLMSYLDGSRGGTLGMKKIVYPAYEENEETGVPISYNYIRNGMINAITELGGVKNYKVDWIGEAKAQPNYAKNWDYMSYRQKTLIPGSDGKQYYQCFIIPYDLEFTSNTTVLEIVKRFRDLYENYEAFFDEEGIFICQLIPSGDDDRIVFDTSFFNEVLISEDTSIDFTEVKNVTEAWGKCFEPEWYKDSGVTYSNNIYSATITGYIDDDHNDYSNGDEFALKIPSTNQVNCKVSLNGLTPILIVDENTEEPIKAGTLLTNTVYDFKIKRRYDSSTRTYNTVAYLQGNWEVHAIDVLSNGVYEDVVVIDGQNYLKYSEDYFKKIYNCNNVHMTVIPNSPFTVQKLGIILNVYENEDMTSDSLGVEGARQENYRVARLTDKITITTKLTPFADVNQKVKYRRSDKNVPEEYLVKHIEHDLSAGTTTWELMKYYRLYTDDIITEKEYILLSDYVSGGDAFEAYNGSINLETQTIYANINAIGLSESQNILSIGTAIDTFFAADQHVIHMYHPVNGNTVININSQNVLSGDIVKTFGNNIILALNANGFYINGVNIGSVAPAIYNHFIQGIVNKDNIIIGSNGSDAVYNKVSIINEAYTRAELMDLTTIPAY